jgi:hypothetical protein
MRTCWTIVSLALIAFSGGCASQGSNQPIANRPIAQKSTTEKPVAQQPLPPVAMDQPILSQPTLRQLPQPVALQPVPVPNLIPPTSASDRLPEVSTGRPDPFATLLVAPTIVATQPAAPPVITPVPVAAAPARPVSPPSSTLPTFQPGGITQQPGVPALPLSVAEAIEISGVVQAGGKTSIILKVPDERTSRYAGIGERLANGQVLVKRVEMGSEPVVILEQDGREFVKSIGAI